MNPEHFLEEARNMQRLHHRKIVQLMGVCTQDEPYYIITEFMANGSLKSYLQENGQENIGFATLIDMAAQVIDVAFILIYILSIFVLLNLISVHFFTSQQNI